MSKPRCVQTANAVLGEGPCWDERTGVLYWVDIKRAAVFRFDPHEGQTGHWPMPRPVGCVAPAGAGGRLVFADSNGFGFLHLTTGEIDRIADPEKAIRGNRFNDGKVDRLGRLWAGTMDDECKRASGSLYRLDPNGTVQQMGSGFVCSNGLGWSPDDRIMYFTDSMARTIWAYEFDLGTGNIGERKVFARLSDDDGIPDGLAVDAEGFVWCAIWDGWRLVRFAPNGTVDRELRTPVQRPTSCTFGGPDLRTLYVTSACDDLDKNALQKGPLAGALFALECDVPGLAQMAFGGA